MSLRPEPMQRLDLCVVREDAPTAALLLAQTGAFNPETAEPSKGDLPDLPGEHYREIYLAARSRLDKILEHTGFDPAVELEGTLQAVSEEDLAQVNDWLAEFWVLCFREQEALRRQKEGETRQVGLLQTLDRFAALDIDLGLLFRPKQFLRVLVGTVPQANLPRLQEALPLAGFILSVFTEGEGIAYAVVAGPAGREREILSLLQNAGWRPTDVPKELMAHPDEARRTLASQTRASMEQTAAERECVQAAVRDNGERLRAAARTLARAAPYAQLAAKALRGRGGLTRVSGWIPSDRVDGLRAALAARLAERYVMEVRPPFPDERPSVPSVLRHPSWLEPFSRLVASYGIPRYGEVDPTLLFAGSYVLMFGMMFGDVGHGGVIAAAGLLLRGTLAPYRTITVAFGVASMVFGALYGSFFGFEHLFHPLWVAPLSDPARLLMVALHFGIGFILVASFISLYNRLAEGQLGKALFDSGGVAGIIFYLASAYAIDSWYRRGTGAAPALVALAALAVSGVYKWRHEHGSSGERVIVAGIETLESGVGYFTNTLSFLRVGAFSLNHVALALAIFTLADRMGTAGYWVTVVLGNVFIIVLEGGIVAIQALRLEYYEGFSRFYSGDGREYRPMRLESKRGEGRRGGADRGPGAGAG